MVDNWQLAVGRSRDLEISKLSDNWNLKCSVKPMALTQSTYFPRAFRFGQARVGANFEEFQYSLEQN